MLLVIRKISASLALLLAIFFFAGAAFTSAAQVYQVKPDMCCGHDSAPTTPAEQGECFNCHCLSCQVYIDKQVNQIKPLVVTDTTYVWLLSELKPSGFIQSIDYPPELV